MCTAFDALCFVLCFVLKYALLAMSFNGADAFIAGDNVLCNTQLCLL